MCNVYVGCVDTMCVLCVHNMFMCGECDVCCVYDICDASSAYLMCLCDVRAMCVLCNMCMYMYMMRVYDVYVGDWAYMHAMNFMPGLWRQAPHLALCGFWRT